MQLISVGWVLTAIGIGARHPGRAASSEPSGCSEMKDRESHEQSENRMSGNDQVRVEIEIFLRALDSYPARFAANPKVTFEEHQASLMAPASGQRGPALEQ